MRRNSQPVRLSLRAPAKFIVLSSLLLGALGCGASEQGTISLASYGNGVAHRHRAAVTAGLPNGASPVALARALGQKTRPGRARRTAGGAR